MQTQTSHKNSNYKSTKIAKQQEKCSSIIKVVFETLLYMRFNKKFFVWPRSGGLSKFTFVLIDY